MQTVPEQAQVFNGTRHERWTRNEYFDKMAAYEKLAEAGHSQRAIADTISVPRTTLQAWKQHRTSLDSAPEVVKFFESGPGLAFLHRLAIGAHIAFVEHGACGVALVCEFFRLTGLDRFLASSEESQRKVNVAIETAIVEYQAKEQPKLAETMPSKEITVAQDETFTGGLCLVAIEPESGFIILEKTAADRTSATWEQYMTDAMKGMKSKVIQSTGDEAKGILSYVSNSLGAAHSPDLFHVQQELSRAVAAPIAAKTRSAERAVKVAKKSVEAIEAEQRKYDENIDSRGPGRPTNYERHIIEAQYVVEASEKEHDRLKAIQEELRAAVRGIGEAYHFANPISGERRSSGIVISHIQQKIDLIRSLAEHEGLRESSMARLDKAERVLPKMGKTLDFVSSYVLREIDKLGLNPALTHNIHTKLLPTAYLERLSLMGNKKERLELATTASNLREPLYTEHGAMAALSSDSREAVEKRVIELAQIFQRSSSRVEGRNGVLSFRHHQLHNIGERKRVVLTTMHNFFITRHDNTTAAERFFGRKPSDLFDAILAAVKIPSRPLSPPRISKCS